MKKEWFVLQTLVGQENKVKRFIDARIVPEKMEEYVGECYIPTETVTENKDGKKRKINRKVFPGFVLVEAALYSYMPVLKADGSAELDDAGNPVVRREIEERTWQFLRETPGLIGKWLLNKPQPLTEEEFAAIRGTKLAQAGEKPRPKVQFSVGEMVKLIDGAFMGLTGQISVDDPDRGKLTVDVQVFNRKVPVEVDYWQVEKQDSASSETAGL